MKPKKPSQTHKLILTCLGVFFVFTALFSKLTPKAYAICSGIDTAGSITCKLTNGTVVYCATNEECTDYKTKNYPSSTTYTQKDNWWNQILDFITNAPRQKYFPDQGCDEGINTALGCIPYKIERFGPALFGFLVGFAGIIALFLMLFAASLYISSAGDHEKLKKAKELFTAAATGLLFIIFSVVLLRVTAGDILQIPGF